MMRTDYCGLLCPSDVGRAARVAGWVQVKRDMGGVIFLDLRDREGMLQVVCNLSLLSREDFERIERVRNESVIAAVGRIFLRDEETVNPALATGLIELRAEKIEILSEAEPLPFPLDGQAREELRLQYRFLDLRRREMIESLRFRHELTACIQAFLSGEGFISVETPILTKSTPEGARDYLVPSRVHPDCFYALPQSPQIFKQLLMVSGVDRYFQIARCFRDEDLRADRQPEFTQVDVEMSFVDQDDVMGQIERMIRHVFEKMLSIQIQIPLPRLSWREAMDKYGSDKPDLRFDLPIIDVTAIAGRTDFSVFNGAARAGGVVRALNIKGGAAFTRADIEEMTEKALSFGAKGMAWIGLREDGSINSILTKYFTGEQMEELFAATGAAPGDLIVFGADTLSTVRRTLGALRLYIADKVGLRKTGAHSLLFVTDFPQFEYSEQEKRFVASHHPFTMPRPEDIPHLMTDPARVRALAYDIVLNGVELGGGSIRIHRGDIQRMMFQALGFSDEQIEKRFGFMLNAFRFGTPPHGGFALGLDRLAMLLLGKESLREVIAFPKIKDASCPMTDAPDGVDGEQLRALGLTQETCVPEKKAAKSRPRIDIDRVAALSRLTLSEHEKARMVRDLENIISFADQLSGIDTRDVPPTAHVQPLQNIWRQDKAEPSFDREALLAAAPDSGGGYIFVPRVVKEDA